MSKAARQFYSQIDGEQVQAWVSQDRREYLAWGNFRGKDIRCKGRSEEAAMSAWRQEADYASKE